MKIKHAIMDIHHANFHPVDELAEKISTTLEENGIDDSNLWILKTFEALRDKINFHFLIEEDTAGFVEVLADLACVLGWPIDDYGEGAELELKRSGTKLFFSREAIDAQGVGCNSVTVTLIRM